MGVTIRAAFARTSIGESLAETAVSLAARIRRYRRAPFADGRGQPFVVAPVLEVSPHLEGRDRGELLLAPVLEQLGSALGRLLPLGRVGLVLGLERRGLGLPPQPEELEPLVEDLARLDSEWLGLGRRVFERLQVICGGQLVPAFARICCNGSVSMLGALDMAGSWLEAGEVDTVLFAALGSGCEAPTLSWLDGLGLTKSLDRLNSLVPGEASVLLVLGRADGAPGLVDMGRNATEEQRMDDAPGGALTRAIDAVLTNTSAPVGDVLLDYNGIEDAKKDWVYASMRTFGRRGIVVDPIEPAQYLGDVGIVTLPLYMALCAEERRSAVIVLAHGVGAERGAIAVSRRET